MHTTSNYEGTLGRTRFPDEGFVVKNPPLASLSTYQDKLKVDINSEVFETTMVDKLKRSYTPLTISIGKVFDKLATEGYLTHIGPTPDPPARRKFKRWDGSAYCKYHRGWGHKTSYFQLKDKIQDLIDEGVIAAP